MPSSGLEARRAVLRHHLAADMIESIALRIAEAWLLCAAIQALLWGIAQRTKNAGIVDVGWALSFTAVVALFGAQAHASVRARL